MYPEAWKPIGGKGMLLTTILHNIYNFFFWFIPAKNTALTQILFQKMIFQFILTNAETFVLLLTK